MKKFNTQILEIFFHYRRFDSKWEVLGKIFDTENVYSYKNEQGKTVTTSPTKWVCIDVLDNQDQLAQYKV